jgi:hypothetical protein
MKRDQIKKLLGENATDEIIDAIMKLHGESVQANQTQITDLTKQLETANGQVTEANKQIEKFKGMKPEELENSVKEWQTKFEQAQKDHAAQLATIEFDRDFDKALTGAKVKYTNEVKARLKLDELKDDKGKFIAERFNEQVGKLKTDAEDLFDSGEEIPKIVTSTNNQPVITDAFEAALLRGAGIEAPKK